MTVFATRCILAAVLSIAALPVPAQQTIVVSKPADGSADNVNAFMDTTRQINADDFKAPRSLFSAEPNLPMPAPSYQPAWNQSDNEAADKRKNWALLTPDQILGVKTPEEVLGTKDQDGRKKLSLEEQFLLRQREVRGALTNGRPSALSWRDDANPFLNGDRNNRSQNQWPSYDSRRDDTVRSDSIKSLKSLAGDMKPSGFQMPDEPQQDSLWISGFARPAQPQATPEQTAALERFRALMTPTPASDKVNPSATYFKPVKAADANFEQPSPNMNPAGHTYNAVENDILQPQRLTPLPGVTGPATKKDEDKRPSWQAQPPPWMQSGPQAYNSGRNY